VAATDQRRPRDRVQTAQMRAWAKDNGWPGLSDRGRLSPEVRSAFEEAHGAPVDEDADVSAMDEDGLEASDEEMAAFEAGIELGQAFPPPADLDEARERAGRDPDARHLLKGGNRRGKPIPPRDKQPPPKVTKAVPAEPWLRVDPYCGGAYAGQVDEIAVKMAPLVCLSPDLVRWFSKSSTFILWTELGIACRPVAEAVIAHHVTKRISLDSKGGVVEQKRGGMDFSAYSARQPNPAAA